jgi:hypothetical protein
MKKLLVFGLATLLVIAFCVPASALENVFGGYWRVRGYKMNDFSGDDDAGNDDDATQTTTRTRLYYTAILNDNLQFVNKFEMNAVFGGQDGDFNDSYGDYGADGIAVKVKNSYADFNTGPLEWQLGVMGGAIGRSLVFDNDFAGAQVVYRGSDNKWWLRGSWLKAYESGVGNTNKKDYDAVALESMFRLGEAGEIRPYVVYSWSKRFQGADAINGVSRIPDGNNADIWWLGLDTDLTLGSVALYGSVVGSLGTLDGQGNDDDTDLKGYVVLAGADIPLGPATIHTQGFYASGDAAEPDRGSDVNGYVGLSDSYYWSEIMGFGTLDDVAVSAGSPGDKLTNIWALNLGVTIKPFDKLSIRGDVWYAEKPQDDFITDEKKLGVEGDLHINYQLVEGLNLELIGAYLWANDATSTDGNNDNDPYEVGFETSLSF